MIFEYLRAKHNLILKLFIVFISAIIIAFLQPTSEVKGHLVDEFDPLWVYQDLIAEKSLLIPKDPTKLKKEIVELKSEAPIFFTENKEEYNLKTKELANLSNKYKEYIVQIIDSIHYSEIIEDLGFDKHKKIILVNSRDGYSRVTDFQNVFTIDSVRKFIKYKLESDNQTEVNESDILPFLTITYYFDKEKTERYLDEKVKSVSIYEHVIKPGDLLVKKGEALTKYKRQLVNSYYKEINSESKRSLGKTVSAVILFSVLLILLLFYLAFFRQSVFGQNKEVFFLFFLVVCATLTTSVFFNLGLIMYALPYCLIPILVRVFFDSRTALFTHLITVLMVSFFMADKLEFILLQLTAGIGTLFAVAEMRKRQQIFMSGVVTLVIYFLVFFSYQKFNGNEGFVTKLSAYLPFVISSSLVLMAFPLIYLSEKVFGFISDFKLLELSDLNQPLLRRLSQDVPGTFQHSLQVANLAEEVIYYIGGNSLLVRTGAMYHDIGKLFNPKYFTENQLGGYSPHMEMQPQESAKIIIEHVIKGVELAKKHKLPEQIIDFIRTHHGTTSTAYFLNIYKKDRKISEQEDKLFRYPGPIPFSKETAVLMLADAVEASSRSLKITDALTINDLVDQIIDAKIAQNQLINSDITFKDITLIKKIFKQRLMNIYHVRIEYPV
ncbi:MAG: HDIG domain-containing protein [Sphingobacteriaceae bacterium]|nr:HDIG domain-containing protein [Sphingobacteriaceae bacterium]